MQKMIKRILDMDKKAQEITLSAQQEKRDAEKAIADSVQAMRQDLLDRARRRVALNHDTENALLDEKWAANRLAYDAQIGRLQALYEEKGEQWIDALVDRVLVSVQQPALSETDDAGA